MSERNEAAHAAAAQQAEHEETETQTRETRPEHPPLNPPDINAREKGFLGRFKDRAAEMAGSVKTTARIGTADRLQTWWNDRAYRKAGDKSLDAFRAENSYAKQIDDAEKSLARLDDGIKLNQGRITPELMAKAARERQRILYRIEQLRKDQDVASSKLESINNRKAIYENKVKDIARDVVERVDQRLNPQETRLRELKAKSDNFNAEINNFRANIKETETVIEGIEHAHKNDEFGLNEERYAEQLSELRLQLRDARRNLEERVKEAQRVDKSYAKLNDRANKWRDKRNQYARVTQRDSEYLRGRDPRDNEAVDNARRRISEVGRVTNNRRGASRDIHADVRDRADAGSAEDYDDENIFADRGEPDMNDALDNRERNLPPEKYDHQQMVETWNKFYASVINIDAKKFGKMLNSRASEHGLSPGQFIDAVRAYNDRYAHADLSKFRWAALEGHLEKLKRVTPQARTRTPDEDFMPPELKTVSRTTPEEAATRAAEEGYEPKRLMDKESFLSPRRETRTETKPEARIEPVRPEAPAATVVPEAAMPEEVPAAEAAPALDETIESEAVQPEVEKRKTEKRKIPSAERLNQLLEKKIPDDLKDFASSKKFKIGQLLSLWNDRFSKDMHINMQKFSAMAEKERGENEKDISLNEFNRLLLNFLESSGFNRKTFEKTFGDRAKAEQFFNDLIKFEQLLRTYDQESAAEPAEEIPAAAAVEKKAEKQETKYSFDQLIKDWNDNYGEYIKIDPEIAKQTASYFGLDLDQMTPSEFDSLLFRLTDITPKQTERFEQYKKIISDFKKFIRTGKKKAEKVDFYAIDNKPYEPEGPSIKIAPEVLNRADANGELVELLSRKLTVEDLCETWNEKSRFKVKPEDIRGFISEQIPDNDTVSIGAFEDGVAAYFKSRPDKKKYMSRARGENRYALSRTPIDRSERPTEFSADILNLEQNIRQNFEV